MKIIEGNIPLYFQFYLQLKSNILLHDIGPGARIPTINELHSRYGVSHGTVRKAMELLEREGLIFKKRGLGTFVREDVDIVMWSPSSSIEEIRSTMRSMRIHQISDGWIDAPNRIRAVFADQEDALEGGRIYKVRRLLIHSEDSRRKSIAEVFVPAWIMKEVSPEKLREVSIFDILADLKNCRAERITQIVRPWLCDSESGRLLGLASGSPLFRRSWNFFAEDGRVLCRSESLVTVTALVREIHIEW